MSGSPPLPALVQPLSFGQVLDGGFAALKAEPRALVLSCAIFVIPFNLLTAFIQRDTQGAFGVWGEVVNSSASGNSPAAVPAAVLAALIPALASVPISRVVWDWFNDRPVVLRRVLRVPIKLWGSALVASLVLLIPKAIAFGFLFLPGIALGALLMLTSPVIAIEELGPFAGIKRATSLARRGYWQVVGVYVLSALVALMLGVALWAMPGALESIVPDSVYPDSIHWVGRAAINMAGSFVTVPAVVAATTMLYIDRRMRSEGLDLSMRIPAEFGSI